MSLHSFDHTITPDVFTASSEYEKRFAGEVGEFFLAVQWDAVSAHLAKLLPAQGTSCSILEVGGGHLQITKNLLELGHHVTVHASTAEALNKLHSGPLASKVTTLVCPLEQLKDVSNQYDVVIALRLIPHVRDEADLLAALVKLSRLGVIFDFASTRGLNSLTKLTFAFKKKIEKNTRPYFNHSPRAIQTTLEKLSCKGTSYKGQFVFPMGLHRALKNVPISKRIETSVGFLQNSFGNPMICGARKV